MMRCEEVVIVNQSRLVIEPKGRQHSHKNSLLIILLVSSTFSGCLYESDSTSISVESEIIWIRAESDILATIDMNATLTVRDIFNGSVIASQRLNGTLIDSGASHCDLVASHPSNTDVFPHQSCLMVNGDFSQDEGLRRLHLNICLVRHYEDYWDRGGYLRLYDTMDVVVCEFLDFSAARENLVVGVFDESDVLSASILSTTWRLIGRNVSENTYAITYPTESGTIRLFSNNSMVNLDTGKEYLIPIPVSCNDVWLTQDNCSNWPATQQDIQSNPDIWDWYRPMIPPYPSENGTRWYVTHCHSGWTAEVVVYDMIEDEYGNVSWRMEDYYWEDLNHWNCATAPVFINELGLIRKAANLSSVHYDGGPTDTTCLSPEYWCSPATIPVSDEWRGKLEPQHHHFRASWFWSRLWFSCHGGLNYELSDWKYSTNVSSNPIRCGNFQNFRGGDYGNDFFGPFDFGRFVVWNEQKGDWGDEEFLEVLYADGANIRVAPDNIGLLDGWDQSSWMGSVSPIAYLIGILAVSTVFSSNVNSYVANISDKYSKKKDMGEKIRSLHYSQWESRDGPSLDLSGGLVSVVEGLILLSFYSLYLALVAAVYLATASLVVVGIVLIIGGYLVGGICFFIGIVLLGPLLG